MRNSFNVILRFGLLVALVSALAAAPVAAQTPAAPRPAAAPEPTSFSGSVDFGARTSSLTGDAARYERYRDLGDGLFLEAYRGNYTKNGWYLTSAIDHLGRRDGRYQAELSRPGRFKAWGQFDKIPMLMSRTTQTLYDMGTPGRLSIADDIQQTLQGTASAQRPAVIAGIIASRASVFTTESHRDIFSGGLQFTLDPATIVKASLQHTRREGVIPYGGGFGFSNAIELPAPVNHKTTAFSSSVERTQGLWLLMAAYDQTSFTNDVEALVWDNPYQLSAAATPNQGRLPLSPSNTSHNFSGSASVRLPGKTRVTAYVNAGLLESDAAIMAHTINATLPVIPLERNTTEGRAETLATNLSLTSRPTAAIGINLRYRYYDYDNQTPVFTQTARVSYDQSYAALATPNETPRFGGARQNFDGELSYHAGLATVGAGFARRDADYHHRIFESSNENTFRVFADAFSSRWFTLHSKYEHSTRRGEGLDTEELVLVGEQPGLRTFDIADRDRDLFTMTGSVTPLPILNISVSAGAGNDDYPHSNFGLSTASHRIYSAGVDATPRDGVSVGLSYDVETYRTTQWSRQANPGVQFTDPSRDWSANGKDRVHSFLASLDVMPETSRVGVRTSYDFNRGRTLYLYGLSTVVDRTLPEGSDLVASTLPQPTQLPEVMSQLSRATVDGIVKLTERLSLGLTYWYEQYKVDDFALDAEAIPRIDLPSSLLIGYRYQPYTAHTVWGRLFVRW